MERVGEEYGLAETDLLSAFDADDLSAFRARAASVERSVVTAIEARGVALAVYPSVEDFLRENP